MRVLKTLVNAAFLLAGCSPEVQDTPAPQPLTATTHGEIIRLDDLTSEVVNPRNVSIYLPPGYAKSDERYPVIYMHDGQNLFEEGYAYGGKEWRVDETLDRLITTGELPPVIIVGPWNTDLRWQEYAPEKVVNALDPSIFGDDGPPEGDTLLADEYLLYLTQELKSHIDQSYRTKPGPETTFLMGSSMGGLISLYGLAEYPDVFSRAACLSIHWPFVSPETSNPQHVAEAFTAYLDTSGLDLTRQAVWFDRGTENLDSHYGPYADAMEIWFEGQPGGDENAIFRLYDGADHNETSWAERLDQPLRFLLKQTTAENTQ